MIDKHYNSHKLINNDPVIDLIKIWTALDSRLFD